jgi:hypothetical protein
MINQYISLKKKDQSLYFIKKPTVFRNWNCFVIVLSFRYYNCFLIFYFWAYSVNVFLEALWHVLRFYNDIIMRRNLFWTNTSFLLFKEYSLSCWNTRVSHIRISFWLYLSLTREILWRGVHLESGLVWFHPNYKDSMEMYPNVHQMFAHHILAKYKLRKSYISSENRHC